MKTIIFIGALLIASTASVAQEEITVNIIVSTDGSLFSSTLNENAQWSVYIEPLPCKWFCDDPVTDTTFVSLESGSTVIEYTTEEKGIHHLLLTEPSNSDTLAYVILYLDHTAIRYRDWRLMVQEKNDKYATFAPSRNNKVESSLGLTPGLQD